jgi:hypothetical protein
MIDAFDLIVAAALRCLDALVARRHACSGADQVDTDQPILCSNAR